MKMPSTCTCFRFAATFLLTVAVPSLSSGGPLLPPSSSVEATGPTGIYALPYTIDEPGSYELRNDVVLGSGNTGITIAVDNVTLNLGDHVVENSAGVGATALDFSGPRKSITVRGGVLHGWTYLIDERADGEADERVLIEDLRFEGANGIQAPESRAYIIRRCQIETLGPGIVVGDMARVAECDILGVSGTRTGAGVVAGKAAQVSRCRVEFGADGIVAGDLSTVRDCIVMNSGNDGIEAENVHHSVVDQSGGQGIVADGHVSYSKADSSDTGIQGATVSYSTASSTNGHGIFARDTVAFSFAETESPDWGIVAEGHPYVQLSDFPRVGGHVAYSTGMNFGEGDSGGVKATGSVVGSTGVGIGGPGVLAETVSEVQGFSTDFIGVIAGQIMNSYGQSEEDDGVQGTVISLTEGLSFGDDEWDYAISGRLGVGSWTGDPAINNSDSSLDYEYDTP